MKKMYERETRPEFDAQCNVVALRVNHLVCGKVVYSRRLAVVEKTTVSSIVDNN